MSYCICKDIKKHCNDMISEYKDHIEADPSNFVAAQSLDIYEEIYGFFTEIEKSIGDFNEKLAKKGRMIFRNKQPKRRRG